MRKLSRLFTGRLVVVADRKTPLNWQCDGTLLYTYASQQSMPLGDVMPPDHYARKNVGYLAAMRSGATSIFDTDDDNIPIHGWHEHRRWGRARVISGAGWCNVYRFFVKDNVWPRGFPLRHVGLRGVARSCGYVNIDSPVQQGMANGNPDVDAIWRMTSQTQSVSFRRDLSVALDRGLWCPFNSQATWWFPDAYHLMYLPVNATFRMCDIWRSFVAQRCLWAMGKRVVFYSPAESRQDRNPHDLMRDFKDEVSGYLHNEEIANILDGLRLKRGASARRDNLLRCYASLVSNRFLPEGEMDSVTQWIKEQMQ